MSFTVNEYKHIIQMITLQTTQLQVPSTLSSLNGLLVVMRDSTIEADYDVQTKMTLFNSNSLTSMNMLVNQTKFFEVDIDSYQQLFQELCHFIPEAKNASFFTSAYETTRFVLGVRLAAAPAQFRESVTSGIKTNALSNNIVIELNFPSAPSTTQRADIFLQSDVVYTLRPGSKELEIKT
jgi:hypothetical protein